MLSRHSAFNTKLTRGIEIGSAVMIQCNGRVKDCMMFCAFFWCFVQSLSCFLPRKGIVCHQKIVEGLLEGLEIGAGDKILLVDCLPNR